MGVLTRRSVLRGSLGIAAAGALARPYIANAAATTATVWWVQGFAQEEDISFKKVVADYEKTAVPLMDDLRAKLQAYAKAHPDFSPILIKYFGSNGPSGPTAPDRTQAGANPAGPRLPPTR